MRQYCLLEYKKPVCYCELPLFQILQFFVNTIFQYRWLYFQLHTYLQGRFILGNKTARTVTFFYTLLLHTLIFLVRYRLSKIKKIKIVIINQKMCGGSKYISLIFVLWFINYYASTLLDTFLAYKNIRIRICYTD